jgi:hypothetical protein
MAVRTDLFASRILIGRVSTVFVAKQVPTSLLYLFGGGSVMNYVLCQYIIVALVMEEPYDFSLQQRVS